jgi:hypothetical protein
LSASEVPNQKILKIVECSKEELVFIEEFQQGRALNPLKSIVFCSKMYQNSIEGKT